MRRPRMRTVLIGAGATLALVTGSTAAYAAAAGPVGSHGRIHASEVSVTGTHHAATQAQLRQAPPIRHARHG